MRSIPSRVLNYGLWSILAWAGFAGFPGRPSAAGADKDDLTEDEQAAVKFALHRLPELRTLDVSEIRKKEAEGRAQARAREFGIYLGPTVDHERSVPRIGYWVYRGLFMEGDHYYQGKLVRGDDSPLLFGFAGPNIKAALTKKYGKPEPGPKFEWMKVKSHVEHVEVNERCHWNVKATITQEGKPLEIKVACELTSLNNDDLIISLIDTERAESVGKALGGQTAAGKTGKPMDLGMPSYPARPLQRILWRRPGIIFPFPFCY
jgi:hypothetical protein